MKINRKIAISTSKVLLVPYEAHHVLKYHGWMQDPHIQEATASEPMSLDEEYENQQSWRSARDKLTFIVCAPLEAPLPHVQAGVSDAEDKMRGDINFFLYPHDDSDDEGTGKESWLTGEVDVMIAETEHRSRGLGRAAVCALLLYLRKNMEVILREHAMQGALRGLMVKIKQNNVASATLFRKLGFVQKGEVNYFGEVTMIMNWANLESQEWWESASEDYQEMSYEGAVDVTR